MDRKAFLKRALQAGAATGVALAGAEKLFAAEENPPAKGSPCDCQAADFTRNWLGDLMDTIETGLDREAQVKLMTGCGRGCFNRHSWKSQLAKDSKGSPEKLIELYKERIVGPDGAVIQGNRAEIRYGGNRCWCPAAKAHTPKPEDLHCECSRAAVQMIWEEALHTPVEVKIVESWRRGGKFCRFAICW